ncbi:unnamed protein product, partial [Amoebophrya sp. A25]
AQSFTTLLASANAREKSGAFAIFTSFERLDGNAPGALVEKKKDKLAAYKKKRKDKNIWSTSPGSLSLQGLMDDPSMSHPFSPTGTENNNIKKEDVASLAQPIHLVNHCYLYTAKASGSSTTVSSASAGPVKVPTSRVTSPTSQASPSKPSAAPVAMKMRTRNAKSHHLHSQGHMFTHLKKLGPGSTSTYARTLEALAQSKDERLFDIFMRNASDDGVGLLSSKRINNVK